MNANYYILDEENKMYTLPTQKITRIADFANILVFVIFPYFILTLNPRILYFF